MEKDITYNYGTTYNYGATYRYDNINKDNIRGRNRQTSFTDETGDCDYDYINSCDHSSYDDEYYD